MIAEGTVETERPGRYLSQLCQHISQIAQSHAGMQANVDWSDERGVVELGTGRCTLRAEDSVLALHVEADDEASLRRIQDVITSRIETIGRRNRLEVRWQPANPPEDTHMADPSRYPDSARDAESGAPPTAGRPHWGVRAAIIAVMTVLLVMVLLHLTGVLGGGTHG